MSLRLDVPTFVARWQCSTLTERSAAPQHIILPVGLVHLMSGPTSGD